MARLLADGHEVCLCAQNLVEIWAVATRPVEANGLGWTAEEAAVEISGLEARFNLLPETPEVFTHWKMLVRTCAIRGKRTHDARLAAVYLANSAQALLTFNAADFANFPGLHLLDPEQPDVWNLVPEFP